MSLKNLALSYLSLSVWDRVKTGREQAMETNLTNTTTIKAAEKQQERIREIMAETGEPFGPAVNIYIKEQEAKVEKSSKDSE